jgi:3'-5' exoribonuclease
MDTKLYVSDLANFMNKEIISTFLVGQKELREGTKDYFLRLKLCDKSGSVSANVWNNAKQISDKFKEGDVIMIKGIVISYREQMQVTVNKVRKLNEGEFDLADYIMATDKDVQGLTERLFRYIDGIGNEYLKQLLLNTFEDKEFLTRFCQAPAAKTWHHNYIGGLLEHTLSVTAICDFASLQYNIDRDLLLTGAILHDVGKVQEYDVRLAIDFTPIGRLVGHIPLGDEMVCKQAAQIDAFPANLLMKLRHLILAHHGEYEKASARLPQTIEAVILHHADNMDAQTVGVRQLVQGNVSDDAEWSEFDRLNQRYYYIK